MKKFHLSTYIFIAISLLVVSSTIFISAVLYFSLKNSLSIEFADRVKAERGELNQAIRNRLDAIENQLTAMTLDNTIRVTLMLGADQQLQEYLNKVYKCQKDVHVFIFKHDSESHYTTSTLDVDLDKISGLISESSQEQVISHDPVHGYSISYSFPIFRQKDRIGTLIGLYLIREDKKIRSFVGSKKGRRILFFDKANAWDLFSNRLVKISRTLQEDAFSPPTFTQHTMDRHLVVAAPISELLGLHYISTQQSLIKATNRVTNLVIIPSLAVILLTILISLLLSRKLSLPLSQVSEFALKVAGGDADLAEKMSHTRIVEVDRLVTSLQTMLDDLKKAEELQRYQELFEGVADIVLIHDFSGRFIKVNEIALETFGFREEEIENIDINAITDRKQAEKIESYLREIEYIAGERKFETELVTRDCEKIAVECHARSILFENRRVVLNLVRDISDRKRAEHSLKESQQTLTTILNSIDATIYVADFDTHEILFMNRYMKEVFGGDLEGKICYEVFRNKKAPCSHCTNEKLVDKNGCPKGVFTWEGENPLTKKWYINYDRAITWTDRPLVRFQVAFDITAMKELEKEREQSEAQLVKIQKMEAIGTLAGGVAHDLNNILTGIVSYPDLLLMQLPEDSQLKGPIETIKETGQKATAIVQDLLTLARRGVVINEVVNLNEIVEDYLRSPELKKLLSFNKKVVVETRLEEGLFNILGSPVHLSKSVMNLVSNAAEAIQGEGLITIATKMVYIDKSIGNYENVKEGEYVCLTVSDTGIGMSDEDSGRIFEPFFTKKVMGRSGTGLGMSVVWGTVKDHEGYIDVQTSLGKGTSFFLYFPLTRQQRIKEDLASPALENKGNGETILVVDDVKEQRDIAGMIFTHLGYMVSAVKSGEEAVEFIRETPVDLVLLDMIMDPGIDGLETYRRILQLNPGQKAIITSGFSETDRVRKVRKLGAKQYIKKPYTVEKIALAVKKELVAHPTEI